MIGCWTALAYFGSSEDQEMPQPQPDWPKTLDEFRAWHERQPEVWEFIDGVPMLMAPGSKTHALLKSRAQRRMRC